MNIIIGKKICELRKKKELTQENLASEMGVSIAAVSKWETGCSIPDIGMLWSLADFFDVSTDELLGRTRNRKKAIVVDDALFVRDCLIKILGENNIEIIGEAEEGNELLKQLKTKKVDLILLDINMPGMNGMDALKKINTNYPEVKVIMCTAVKDQAVIDKAYELGVTGFVTKPFKPDEIVTCIELLNK